MMFYIFKNTGEYVGTRGVAPTEADLVGIEATEENIAKMSTPFEHILVNGEIVNGDPLPVPVPQTASKMRFFLALFNIGITRNIVYDVINQIPDNTLKEIVLIKFDLSQEFDRNDEHLNMMANHFNIKQEQLDNLFIQANE